MLSAYYLGQKGYKVTVIDQEPYPAMRTSYANGGQVSVSNSEVWTTWGNVQKGVKWMLTKDAPLLVRPRLDYAMISWMTKFLFHTAKGSYRANTEQTIKMGIESRKLYDQICQEENIKFDRSDCGILHFYKDQKYWDHAQEVQSLYQSNGLEWDLLSDREMCAKDPALSGISNVLGAAWTPSDWVGDIHKFCYELMTVLKQNFNVEFMFNRPVTDGYLNILKCQFDTVVISAGVGSVKLASELRDQLDIYPVKGYSITINNVDPELLPKVSLLDDQAKIVTSSLGNRFRVAGTAELAGENYDIRRDRIDPLLKWVHTNFPKINTHDYTSWACLRPMTPNMMPIVKRSSTNPNVYYNTGHGHLGWTLGAVTAKQLSDMI
jgi:D-amino-acid dehydrogenase